MTESGSGVAVDRAGSMVMREDASLTAAAPGAGKGSSSAPSGRWIVLVVVCLAQFMVVLDATVVNVALPSIQAGLHFTEANLQWVVNGYTLVFGGFLLLGGRASDLIGRKRLFIAGLILFTGASLFNGLASSSTMLIAGRALQGLGGALVSPAALSIVTTSFPDSAERTKAVSAWSAIAVSGSAFGLLLGGILTDAISWRWIFFINAPVGALTLLATLRLVPESRAQLRHRSFDLAGAVAVTSGLVLLVYAIVGAQAHGWGSVRTIVLCLVAVSLLIAFVLIEGRSRFPLMRLAIFKIRALAVADGALLLLASGMFSMFYFASLYVQDVLGYSPLKAGVAFLPVTLGIMVGAGISQRLMRSIGIRGTSVAGFVLATAGMAWLIRLPVDGAYLADLLSGLMALSFGMGLVFVPITLLATSGVEADDAGLASGLFNTAQQVGGALGLAVLSTLAADRTSGLLTGNSGVGAASAEVAGFHIAFIGGTAMMAGAALMMVALLRRRHLARIDVTAVPAAVGA